MLIGSPSQVFDEQFGSPDPKFFGDATFPETVMPAAPPYPCIQVFDQVSEFVASV